MNKAGEEFFVCFIDLLGQKDFFEHVRVGETSEQVERTSAMLCEMVRFAKLRLTKTFAAYPACKYGVQLYSDSLVVYMDVPPDDRLFIIREWLLSLIKILYVALSFRIPVRGGIAKGLGWEVSKNSLAGDVVERAAYLESVLADYPRVVLDGMLIDWFREHCPDMFGVAIDADQDGVCILDYASSSVLGAAEFLREKRLGSELFNFVYKRYAEYCYKDGEDGSGYSIKKLNLARRYCMWVAYLHRNFGFDYHALPELSPLRKFNNNKSQTNVGRYHALLMHAKCPLFEDASIKKELNLKHAENETLWLSKVSCIFDGSFNEDDSEFRRNVVYAKWISNHLLKTKRIGNLCLVYCPADAGTDLAMLSILASHISYLMIKLGARGTFVQGAFVEGIGWEIEEDGSHTLYGPVMTDCYVKMVKLAYSPRIVVDDKIYRHVQGMVVKEDDISWIQSSLSRDFDGVARLDFLRVDKNAQYAQPPLLHETITDVEKMSGAVQKYFDVLASHYTDPKYLNVARRLLLLKEYVHEAEKAWKQYEDTLG